MKTTPKFTLVALTFAILVAITFTGCATSGGRSTSGTHQMGSPKNGFPMSNQSMPGR